MMIPQSLYRQWRRLCFLAGGGLIAGFAVIAERQSVVAAGAWSSVAAALLWFELYLLRQLLPLNYLEPGTGCLPRLTLATGVTLLRGGCIATMGGFAMAPWPSIWQAGSRFAWLPGILYLAGATLDFLDGCCARLTGRVTRLGEVLDTRFDALGLLAASVLAVVYGRLPAFYLAVGAAYYVLQAAIRIRRALGKPCYAQKSRPSARILAGLQMGFAGVALLPLFPAELLRVAAVTISVPFLAGFVIDWRQVAGKDCVCPLRSFRTP